MKQVAHYIGQLTKLSTPPEVSYALLKEMPNGKDTQVTAETEFFIKNGIAQGEQFEIVIYQSIDGTISSSVHKIDPNAQVPNCDI